MRIWVVAPTYPTQEAPAGGAFVRHQALALAARGHEVTVVELAPAARTRPWAALTARSWTEDAGDGKDGSVRVVRAQVAGGPVAGLRAIGRRAGARLLEALAAEQGRPDLLHLHFTQLPGLAGTRFGRAAGIPTVLTVHENEDWLRAETAVPACRQAWREADAIVRVSAKEKALLERWNPAVHIIPNGFSSEHAAGGSKASARQALGLAPEASWGVAVGWFIPRKRQDVLLRAARQARDAGVDLRLLLVGEGPERPALERLVADLGLADAVVFAGKLSNADLARAYAAADVVCLASDAEGNPTVMFEAFGAGRPYVGTDVGGAADVVAEVGYGRLVPRRDPAAFAAALQAVLADLPEPEEVRRAARRFSWDAIAERLEGVYARVNAADAEADASA